MSAHMQEPYDDEDRHFREEQERERRAGDAFLAGRLVDPRESCPDCGHPGYTHSQTEEGAKRYGCSTRVDFTWSPTHDRACGCSRRCTGDMVDRAFAGREDRVRRADEPKP